MVSLCPGPQQWNLLTFIQKKPRFIAGPRIRPSMKTSDLSPMKSLVITFLLLHQKVTIPRGIYYQPYSSHLVLHGFLKLMARREKQHRFKGEDRTKPVQIDVCYSLGKSAKELLWIGTSKEEGGMANSHTPRWVWVLLIHGWNTLRPLQWGLSPNLDVWRVDIHTDRQTEAVFCPLHSQNELVYSGHTS